MYKYLFASQLKLGFFVFFFFLLKLNENKRRIETEIDDKRTIIYNKKSELENKKWNLEHFEKSKPEKPESLENDEEYKRAKNNIIFFNTAAKDDKTKYNYTNDNLYRYALFDVFVYERAYGRALNVNFSNIINLRFSLCNETRLTQILNKIGVKYAIGGVNMIKSGIYGSLGAVMIFALIIFFGPAKILSYVPFTSDSGGQRTMKRKVNQNVKKRKTGKIRKVIENDI